MNRSVKEIAEQLAELNRPAHEPDEGPFVSLTFELPVRVIARLQALADREGAPFAEIAIMSLRSGLIALETDGREFEDSESPF